MTRVSTAQAFDTSLQQLQRRQSEMTDAQQRLTSGKRVSRASDDPTAAARAERALASVSRIDADKRSVETSRAAMQQTEASLGQAGDLLQRARELLVAAGNGAYGDSERQSIAAELRGIRGQLLAVANRDDGADGFLFGGQGSAEAPFIDAPGGVEFRGMAGRNEVGDEQLPITLDGGALWMTARTGNGVFETSVVASTGTAWMDAGRVVDPSAITGSTYNIQFANTAGQITYSVLRDGLATAQTNVAYVAGTAIQADGMSVVVSGVPANGDDFQLAPSAATLTVFDVMDAAISDLSSAGRRASQVTQNRVENLRDIDQVLTKLQGARSDVGGVLNRIDSVTERLADARLLGESERSSAEDLDMVAGISDFQNRQSGYDAALKSYSMVQRLSLFQYLNL